MSDALTQSPLNMYNIQDTIDELVAKTRDAAAKIDETEIALSQLKQEFNLLSAKVMAIERGIQYYDEIKLPPHDEETISRLVKKWEDKIKVGRTFMSSSIAGEIIIVVPDILVAFGDNTNHSTIAWDDVITMLS